MKITDTVAAIVRSKVEELGYELYDVEYVKEYGTMNLIIYIDRPEGVDLDDCEKVSRAIDPLIDEADPIDEAYCMCVSSVGIDHPIKKDRDFERAMGEIVEIKLYAPINKKKDLKGRLAAFDSETFTVEPEKGDAIVIKRKDAALIRQWIDFNKLED